MNLDELRVFAKVADLASFSRAAEQLGLAKGYVSTQVRQLEERLGTRLLQRTTRSVRLTPDGERFLVSCKDLLTEAEQLQAMFLPAAAGLTGRLRIDLPAGIAKNLVIPHLPAFSDANPLLEIGISTTDHRVDLIHEGFDCLLRIGEPGVSDLIARHLGNMQMINAASPDYLQRHGVPQTLDDLALHRVVHYSSGLSVHDAHWEYKDADGQYKTQAVKAAVAVNGTDAYQAAALAGLGMIQAPALGLQHLLEQGSLVAVMPGYTARAMPVSLLYANRRQLAPRVQAVMDWLTDILTPWLQQQ